MPHRLLLCEMTWPTQVLEQSGMQSKRVMNSRLEFRSLVLENRQVSLLLFAPTFYLQVKEPSITDQKALTYTGYETHQRPEGTYTGYETHDIIL